MRKPFPIFALLALGGLALAQITIIPPSGSGGSFNEAGNYEPTGTWDFSAGTVTLPPFSNYTSFPVEWCVALSDETTAITTGTAKVTMRAPYAFTVLAVSASVNTASSSGIPTIDINEGL